MKSLGRCKKIWCLLFVTLALTSCYNNRIYYDMEEQAVKTCNGKVIRQLYITNESENVFYHFSKLDEKKGVNSFSFNNLSEQYQLEVINGKIPLKDFKLTPKMKYKISNSSYGDAASSDIEIKVGVNGIITQASRTACD
jgi:hypothetical protein